MNNITVNQEFLDQHKRRSGIMLLSLLICGDLGFIALHLINTFSPLLNNNMLHNIEKDRSYGEAFQYLKFYWVGILLAYCGITRKTGKYAAWILIFAYLGLDDSQQFHERFANFFAKSIGLRPVFGLRQRDMGEFAVSFTAGLILLPALIWAYRNGRPEFKKISQDLLLLVGLLVFFGVLFDMLHIIVDLGWGFTFALGLLEDGGEMLSLSVIVWYAFLLGVNGNNGDYLIDRLSSRFHSIRKQDDLLGSKSI